MVKKVASHRVKIRIQVKKQRVKIRIQVKARVIHILRLSLMLFGNCKYNFAIQVQDDSYTLNAQKFHLVLSSGILAPS